MKLRFDAHLDYQQHAIAAVRDLFRGQEIGRSTFTVELPPSAEPLLGRELAPRAEGVANRLGLLPEDVLANLRAVQERHGLPPSSKLTEPFDFTVEMETGTGKTYVYLRTILELNRAYGFTKFIVVVPSVAIREGVKKTLDITRDHFRGLYDGVVYDHFVYDSKKPSQIRRFATSSSIQIMIVTVGAINKKSVNVLYRTANESTGDRAPIELIGQTNPIVIVDEPQSVDGGVNGKGRKALAAMNPLCRIGYSATPVNVQHLVYRLDAVDAYARELVKQIEVASATVALAHNRPYVRLVSTGVKNGAVYAKAELDVALSGGGVKRTVKTLMQHDDLAEITKRAVYEGYRVGTIRRSSGSQAASLELRGPGTAIPLAEGEEYGAIDPEQLTRAMVRRTIDEHLKKARDLHPRGIKVLTLFFIPRVADYAQYDEHGERTPGPLATVFEEEYQRLVTSEAHRDLFTDAPAPEASAVHRGYFSQDRKRFGGRRGPMKDVFTDTSGSTKKDDDTYDLIMREKERLLSLDEPVAFIFSHSALREGWDNPNVFQICTLRDIVSERQRRQTIGRGLRLCVNQDGERIHGFATNTLTVVATEAVEAFADGLQKEIEDTTSVKFGHVGPFSFANIPLAGQDDPLGEPAVLGGEASRALWDFFVQQGYIGANHKAQDALKVALRDGKLALPEDRETERADIEAWLKRLTAGLPIRDADKRTANPVRPEVLADSEFLKLWARIKHRTVYRVDFDPDRLAETCARALQTEVIVPRARIDWTKGTLAVGAGGVEAQDVAVVQRGETVREADLRLPDILTELQNRTGLTRQTLADILTREADILDAFRRNPDAFITEAAKVINREKARVLLDGLTYLPLGEAHDYDIGLFQDEAETLYRDDRLLKDTSGRCVYEYVAYDSETVERSFAEALMADENVLAFVKLPSRFKIPTPLGAYNPDWALVLRRDDLPPRLYFVAETKGTTGTMALRGSEAYKVRCGKAHFAALLDRDDLAPFEGGRVEDSGRESEGARYVQVQTLGQVYDRAEAAS